MRSYKKFYKIKRRKMRKLLRLRRQQRVLNSSAVRIPNKFIRASGYKRKGKAGGVAGMAKNVSRFFRVPPKELNAVLRSTNIFIRLDEDGGAESTGGIGCITVRPKPIAGLMFEYTAKAADSIDPAKVFGVTSYFSGYNYCKVNAIKVKAILHNHQPNYSVTVVCVPISKTTDLWNGIDPKSVLQKPDAKSFLLTPRGSAKEKKNVKIYLKTSQFQETGPDAFRFDYRGKADINAASGAAEAPNPFFYAFYFISVPMKVSDGSIQRGPVQIDAKLIVKYYVRFFDRKTTDPF